ncbi:MAG: RNA polymerase sporulation sigma factor SigH [Actinobacteria bacterium]|nr:RNA polymerase sporulation sigma factor SigH [Actinomycetota bacterium]
MSDEDLIACIRGGDSQAEAYLLQKYQYLVHVKAKSYFLDGAEHDDTIQEGMIGLYKAIRDYKFNDICSFRSFAVLCITRQIITAVKTHTRKKHNPLSCYRPLEANTFDESGDVVYFAGNGTGSKVEDPLELFIFEDEVSRIIHILREKLSGLEWKVLVSYLEGKSYKEIAGEIKRDTKVVDNALCRIKVKIKNHVEPLLN